MATRPFDIIVFGASGYTGRCVAKYLHFLSTKLKWAIAGRSHAKLAAVKSELIEMKLPSTSSTTTSSSSSSNLPDILIGDVTDIRGLKDMFSTCTLVLNCTGPYKKLGNDIVEACIASRTNYMDICGEPLFMEKSFLEYHEKAANLGLLILHACAFDSVPADFGCLFAMQQYPPQMCSSIESYLMIRCPEGLSAHYTAFECAVRSVGDTGAVVQLRKQIKQKYNPPQQMEIGPKLKKRAKYYFDKRVRKYTLPFTGADVSVVRSTQRSLAILEGQVIWPQYNAYVAISSLYNVAATSFYESMCNSLAGFSIGRSLLLKFPEVATGGVFTHTGPTEKQLEKTTFEVHFFAKGYSTYISELCDPNGTSTTNSKTKNEKDNNNDVGQEIGREAEDDKQLSKGMGRDVEKEVGKDIGNEIGKDIDKEGYSRDNSRVGAMSLMIHPSEVQQTSVLGKNCAPMVLFETYGFKPNTAPTAPPTDRDVHIIVSGPEPMYIATPMILVTLAICLLEEREILPVGGVFTPAAAFHKSVTIIDRLDRAGISFTIQDSKVLNESEQYLDEFLVATVSTTEDGENENENENENDEDKSQKSMKANDSFEEIGLDQELDDYQKFSHQNTILSLEDNNSNNIEESISTTIAIDGHEDKLLVQDDVLLPDFESQDEVIIHDPREVISGDDLVNVSTDTFNDASADISDNISVNINVDVDTAGNVSMIHDIDHSSLPLEDISVSVTNDHENTTITSSTSSSSSTINNPDIEKVNEVSLEDIEISPNKNKVSEYEDDDVFTDALADDPNSNSIDVEYLHS